MKIVVSTAAALCLAAGSLPAAAQDEAARRAATEVAARVPLERATKGAPYSAETVIEATQTLADGNRISRKTTGRVYRDGEGRTRREEDRPNGTVAISITDPVGGFSYSLDAASKIAWRTPIGVGGAIMRKLDAAKVEEAQTAMKRVLEEKMNAEGNEAAAAAAARGGSATGVGGALMRGRGLAAAPDTPLEHKTLEGIAVEGRKSTTIIPAGQVGNEQPLTITSEQWRSSDLNVLVMTRHADPRTGESSYRLTNIVRAEPDPSLFMVPADYTVKDTGIRRMEPARK